MELTDKNHLLRRIKKDAFNSSHFVWLRSEFKFFETSNAWIFAHQRRGSVTLIGLEPLIPDFASLSDEAALAEFDRAWAEFAAAERIRIATFVGIGARFMRLIARRGFMALKVGREPWVDLKDFYPKGKSGKGVRSSRNQAARAGAVIEEWSAESLRADPGRHAIIHGIHEQWLDSSFIHLEGFLLCSDPFAHSNERRYFVVRSPARVEGYLVATPVGSSGDWYLEDLMFRPDAMRGYSEFLTLSAMEILGASGVRELSLGVVSMTTLEFETPSEVPRYLYRLVLGVRKALRFFYNAGGIELYRKRFNVRHWTDVYAASALVSGPPVSLVGRWLRSVAAGLLAHKPTLRLSASRLKWSIKKRLNVYPVSIAWLTLTLVCFAAVNRFGALPAGTWERFAFRPETPLLEWFYRTFTNDVLAPNAREFWVLFVSAVVLMPPIEKRFHSRVFGWLLLGLSFSDDFINYLLVIKPLEYLHLPVFQSLIAKPEVGSSLILTALAGVFVNQWGRTREFLLVGISFVLVFGAVMGSSKLAAYVGNIHYFLFFLLGYTLGKALFEMERERDRENSKAKKSA